MHIAIEGCSHGSLTTIYNTVARCEKEKGIKVDLLLLCGDFQALRNKADFESLAVPDKFRELGTFTDYYSGDKLAPILTIVIGGNHEASRYMWELYHGGWLAPNIYYLGAGGSVMVNDIRISGLSGIFKGYDYRTGHWETTPYDRSSVKSAYHVREYDVWKMLQLSPRTGKNEVDLFMSHDWPVTITKHGDERALLRRKTFFTEEVHTNTLGSPPLLEVLHYLKPKYWFSAHLHVKFSALVDHSTLLALESVGWRTKTGQGRSMEMTKRRWDKSPSRDAGYGGQQQDQVMRAAAMSSAGASLKNPDAIELDSDEDEVVVAGAQDQKETGPPDLSGNPDEIDLDDDDEDLVEPMDQPVGTGVVSSHNSSKATFNASANPDAIGLDDDEEEDVAQVIQNDLAASFVDPSSTSSANPDFVALDDDDEVDEEMPEIADESVDVVEELRATDASDANGILGTTQAETAMAVDHAAHDEAADGVHRTKFLALDKCGPGKDFLQILEIGPPHEGDPPRLLFDPEWLAIMKATHPWFSLQKQPKPFPAPDRLSMAMEQAKAWVVANTVDGVRARNFAERLQVSRQASKTEGADLAEGAAGQVPELPLPETLHPLDIENVQRFWPTAAAEKLGGDHPARWYTNAQTQALCDFLEIPNLINPVPVEVIRSA